MSALIAALAAVFSACAPAGTRAQSAMQAPPAGDAWACEPASGSPMTGNPDDVAARYWTAFHFGSRCELSALAWGPVCGTDEHLTPQDIEAARFASRDLRKPVQLGAAWLAGENYSFEIPVGPSDFEMSFRLNRAADAPPYRADEGPTWKLTCIDLGDPSGASWRWPRRR